MKPNQQQLHFRRRNDGYDMRMARALTMALTCIRCLSNYRRPTNRSVHTA